MKTIFAVVSLCVFAGFSSAQELVRTAAERGFAQAAIEAETLAQASQAPKMSPAEKAQSVKFLEGFQSGQLARLEALVEQFADATPRLGLSFGSSGLWVAKLRKTGPAAQAGIAQGDVLEQVNGADVRGLDAEAAAHLIAQSANPVALTLSRDGVSRSLSISKRDIALSAEELAPLQEAVRGLEATAEHLRHGVDNDAYTVTQFEEDALALAYDYLDALTTVRDAGFEPEAVASR